MYDKKFYNKQFRDLVQSKSMKTSNLGSRQKIHPAGMGKGLDWTQIAPRRQHPKSQNNFQHQQNVYCVL